MRRVVLVLVLLVAAGCSVPVASATSNEPATEPSEIPEPAASLLLPSPAAAPPAAKPEGHLAHPVCAGVDASKLKKERPQTAACCYPAKELIVRPIRATFPALRACYLARTNTEAEGRVVFEFRVEQDGSVQRVCTGDATQMDDENAARCMVEAMRKIRYPARDDADLDLCGLLHFNYPVTFEH